MTPTSEQTAIVEAATKSEDNLIIKALAGTGKTSTLFMLAEALAPLPILCLAFNKSIALAMQEKLPNNCQAMTLNSLGHRAWGNTIGKKLILKANKTYSILSELLKDLNKEDQKEAYSNFSDLIQYVDAAKTCGYMPDGKFETAKRLMNDDELYNWYEETPTDFQFDLIKKAYEIGIKQANFGTIDFNDQILMPTVFSSLFPVFPLVMIDEAQDLSALNHAMLRKLVKKRLIAVGDECQAIYGFRGAHEESMQLLEKTFNMRPFILSTCFRCPSNVIKEAQWRAPHMNWPSSAPEGHVETWEKWSISRLPNECAIICRNNAPIFSLAIQILRSGRYPTIVGNDIGKGLIKIMQKFGPTNLPQRDCIEALNLWLEERLKKTKEQRKTIDKADCIKLFLREGRDLGEAIAYANHLMECSGQIKMMTGHKSKGLEFPTVILLDQYLLHLDEGQDKNLKYVMQTRAQQNLIYAETATLEK